MDFWAWGKVEPVFLGISLWVGYFVFLSALQTIIMVQLINKKVNVYRPLRQLIKKQNK